MKITHQNSSRPLQAPFILAAAVSLFACVAPNKNFCDTNGDCLEGSTCDRQAHQCEALSAPDGGGVDDGAPESAPTCSSDTRQCTKVSPAGWSAPLERVTAPAGESMPQCTGVFEQDVGLFGAQIVTSGSCDCHCGATTSLRCTPGGLQEWTSSSEASCELGACDILNSSCLAQSKSLVAGACTAIPLSMENEPFLRAKSGNIIGATCAPATVSGDLRSEFSEQVRLCERVLVNLSSEGCSEDEICGPRNTDATNANLCIVRQGEHQCPEASGFTERSLLYTGIDDTRNCSSGFCSCSAPTGSCGGKIHLYNGGVDRDLCDVPLATLEYASNVLGTDNLCEPLPAGASAARYVVNPSSHACRKIGEANILGGAKGTGLNTLCCML